MSQAMALKAGNLGHDGWRVVIGLKNELDFDLDLLLGTDYGFRPRTIKPN